MVKVRVLLPMATTDSYRLEFHCACAQAHARLVSEHSAHLLNLCERHSVRVFSYDETKRRIACDQDHDEDVSNSSSRQHNCNSDDNNEVILQKNLCIATVLEHLDAKWVSNVLIHAPIGVGSTQDVLKSRVMPWTGKHGWTVITGFQNGGRGRRGNLWSSPPGSISLTLCLTLSSQDMHKLVFLQYIAALAIVQAALETPNAATNVRIKWPNDVFANAQKIAGVLCEATVSGSAQACEVLVGIGVNVCNSSPTTSLLNVGSMSKNDTETARERFAGLVLTRFEQLYDEFCEFGFERRLLDLYVCSWMHGGQEVRIGDENGPAATVKGLAPNGWVRVFRHDWRAFQDLPPEETSLDMVQGIIKQK